MGCASTLRDRDRLARTVVIHDIFRASNTIIAVLERGAERVIPLEEVSEAVRLKRENPGWVALGERGGIMLEGFDGDNAPSREDVHVAGKTVLLTTSGGTRCIAACGAEKRVLIGSFANASAVLARLKGAAPEDVTFWAVGVSGEEPAEEDELCAAEMESRLRGERVDAAATDAALLACAGADRLRGHGLHADLALCCRRDITDIVPELTVFPDGLTGFRC